MGADLDICEAYVSIKSHATRLPYIVPSGRTSLNIPVESLEWTDVMYEATISEISAGKITFPTLIAFPELRPLLQQIKEGDRVEIFGFQPDCGDPVMAGFIPVNGITEQDGRVSLDFDDTLGQLRWQHLRRTEYLSAPASGLYGRAMSAWTDIVAEDWLPGGPSADYTVTPGTLGFGTALQPTFGVGKISIAGTGGGVGVVPTDAVVQANRTAFIPQPGATFISECDFSYASKYVSTGGWLEMGLMSVVPHSPYGYWALGLISYGLNGSYPQAQLIAMDVVRSDGTNLLTQPGGVSNGAAGTFPSPQSHRLGVVLAFNPGTVTMSIYLDNIQLLYFTQTWVFDATTYYPSLYFRAQDVGENITVTNWRVRHLVPVLNQAARFNPQTLDALTYQPNNEDNLQFLQLVAQKDNAEYRPLYHAWPLPDELELDAVSALGKTASRLLGYEQPPALPSEGSPQVSPAPVIMDSANFLVAPPFRLEEGYNLESAPKVLPRANAHANDVIRMGASSIDSQVFGEQWSPAETGRPQHGQAGAYPYFELITNDDRVGIQSLVQTLANLDLARRIDPTPSIEVAYVEELPWAFRWRGGDQVFTKTLSLRNNVEQELRAQKIAYKAGSPLRTVTLGKTDWDPSMLRQMSESMKISWLYEQSGTNPGIYVYPFTGSINAGGISSLFTIPLDKYTTGSALVYAALHWFADANVLLLQPSINGGNISVAGITSPSQTDSGLVLCTSSFQAAGTFALRFQNMDSVSRNLTGAFLVLRIKG